LFAILFPYCVSFFAAIAGTGGFTFGVFFGLISAAIVVVARLLLVFSVQKVHLSVKS